MKDNMCPQDMEPMCPNGAMSRIAGGNDGQDADKGCQCVPDFLMAMVMPQPVGRMTAVDRAMTKATIKFGKKSCKCSYEMNAKNCKRSKIGCDKKCSGKAMGVELGDWLVDLSSAKGKVKVLKCEKQEIVTAGPVPTGPGSGSGGNGGGEGSGSGNGEGGAGGSRCACVSKGMGGTGPTPPTGSGSGSEPMPPTGSGSGSEPMPPTGSGSGSEPMPPTGSGSGSEPMPPTGSGSGSGIILTTVAPSLPNIISNGDFETGELSPWTCRQAECDLHGGFLSITERKKEWSGIIQLLPVETFSTEKDLKVGLNFSMKSVESVTANWKIKVTKSGQVRYFTIHSASVDAEWQEIFSFLTLPTFILGSQEVQLYLEATPAEADLALDNISLEPQDVGNWEEEANRRIDTLRKKNVDINFNLDSINPDDLQIEVNQKNHKFPFGTAVKSPRIAECYDANNDDLYCGFVRDNYNWLVDTFRMKWRGMEQTEGVIDTEVPDKMIKWAHSHEQTVRGHALLWAKRHNNPSWVQTMYGAELKTAIFDRVNTTIRHFEEYNVPHWDVINEMVDQGAENHTFYLDQTGDPEIREKVFRYCKELSPDTLFFLNDYGVILNKYGRFTLYQEQIRELLAAGAPIDAIGLQSHINGHDVVDVNAIKHHVDQLWEEFQLPIWVTEFDWNAGNDVAMGDHSFHAEQVENFYRLMFSHPAVDGILMWNMNILDADTDLPNKAGEEYQRLYHEEWRSSQTIQASAAGLTFRAFLGHYSIRVLQGAEVLAEQEFSLDEDVHIACTEDSSGISCS
jgi:GH35 family endo-1,4-beta-xylanase